MVMAKIETVTEPRSGVSVPITLDKKRMEFTAKFADFSITDKDGEKVRDAVLRAIRERAELQWTAVIEAHQTRNYGSIGTGYGSLPLEQNEEMGLRIERFYVARKFDGDWVRAEWHTPDGERMHKAKHWHGRSYMTEIKYTMHESETDLRYNNKLKGEYLMPYDDALWTGLEEVLRKMKMIRELVKGLLSSEEGVQRLIAVGSGTPLLGAGE
jgi:hypothetical protein